MTWDRGVAQDSFRPPPTVEFDQEQVDVEWAARAERRLYEHLLLLKELMEKNQVRVECRTSICVVGIAIPVDLRMWPEVDKDHLRNAPGLELYDEKPILDLFHREARLYFLRREKG